MVYGKVVPENPTIFLPKSCSFEIYVIRFISDVSPGIDLNSQNITFVPNFDSK